MTAAVTRSRPIAEPPVLPASTGRVEWVNYAKGIGIVLVVVGHVWRGVSGLATPGQGRVMTVVDTAIYQFHMPLFFFLSGLFVARSAQRPFGAFVLQKLKTIAYPYVIWTLIQAAVASRAGAAAHQRVGFLEVLKQLPYQPFQQFWFLYVLFLCMIAFSVLTKLRLGAIAILIVAIDFYVMRSLLPGMNWGPLYQFSADFVYFAAGAAIAPILLSGITRFAWPALLTAAAVQYTIIVALSARSPGLVLMNDVTLLAAIGIAASAAIAAALAKTPGTSVLAFLGDKSLPIYVAHVVFAAGTRAILIKLHVTDLPVQLLAGTVAGLGFPVLLDYGSRRVGFRYLFTL